MNNYSVVDKKIGETPLQALEAFRKTRSELEYEPMTYAGRLDPMAEGKLIILVGDECKRREKYTNLDKEYEFEILFGVSTDTGDVLGLTESAAGKQLNESDIGRAVRGCVGKQELSYPAFSSKTVNGKPLFEHALSGSISDLEIPKTNIEVYRMAYTGSYRINREKLLQEISGKIGKLAGGEFRKDDILARWNETRLLTEKDYLIAKCKAVVSSGTYIRVLAPLIAERLGTKGLAYLIRRTKIGHYHKVIGSFGFWTHTF